MAPGYRETEGRLTTIEAELEHKEAGRQQQVTVATLYEQAQGLARSRLWSQALAKMDQIRALDPQFADPAGIAAKAQEEMAKKDDKPRRKVGLPAWFWPAVAAAGILLVIVVVVVVALQGAGDGGAQPPAVAAAGDTWTSPVDDQLMVYVPAGTFWMGTSDDEIDALKPLCTDCSWVGIADNEQPQHEVHLDAFWIDQTEVTNAQYAAFLNDTVSGPDSQASWLDLRSVDCLIEWGVGRYQPKEGYANHPVIEVTWNGAVAYCTWAGKRLPTEAEWEKAARGDDRRIWPWGNSIPNCDRAQYAECAGRTVAVGSKPGGASPYGVLGMAGNVREWTSSAFGEYPYQAGDGREDMEANLVRMLRGGAWGFNPVDVRAAGRGDHDPFSAYDNAGFRCARSGSEP
jgi:formylglycine-generating enzyme required for sulfatase activity